MQYNNIININLIGGCYDWCGNCNAGEMSGYYLSSTGKFKLILDINIIVDPTLWNKIDMIEIFDINNFLIQYANYPMENNPYHFKFNLEKKLIDTKIKICYQNILPQSEKDRLLLKRVQMQTIYSEFVTIPNLEIINTSDDCAICLESMTNSIHEIFEIIKVNKYIDESDKNLEKILMKAFGNYPDVISDIYVSLCKHVFHMKCL